MMDYKKTAKIVLKRIGSGKQHFVHFSLFISWKILFLVIVVGVENAYGGNAGL